MPSSLLLVLALVAAPPAPAETPAPVELVDRILAVVDDRPLLLSEVRAVEATRSLDRERALEESIDERLMFLEAARLPQAEVADDEVQRALDSLLDTRPALGDLVPSSELERLLRRQLSIVKYIEFRFRPQVRVSEEDLRTAWNEDFSGAPAGPPFEEAAPALRERLERRALDQRIESWVRDLRQRASVRYVRGPGSPPVPAAEASGP
jgi:hypothetical protein